MQCFVAENSDSDVDDALASEMSEEDRGGVSLQDRHLKVGDTFVSLEDFQKRLTEFQDETYCTYYRRDAITIQQCRKRGVKKRIKEELKYYMLMYCCIHGGKKFKTTTTGQRSSSTFQKECEASFKLRVNEGGDALVISQVNLEHNHQCSKKLYQHLPQTRRLKAEDRQKVSHLLSLDANRKKVKHQMEAQTNKVILLKDLSNIAAKGSNKNNLVNTVEMLEKDYGAECHIYEEENTFKGLFFTTPAMKASMKAFPEFVGIDATFKLLDIRCPVYLMIVEDSEGCSEIVAGCILITEDKASITWLLDRFKAAHPSWKKIKCFMADKDLLERDVIKTSFPSANVLICIFHSLRTFNRGITCEKLGITTGQRDAAKEIFQKMVYAKSEEYYMTLYDRIQEMPPPLIKYFDDNWHSIRGEWTLSPNYMRYNFLNTTNNRIESLNAKVKSVVKRYSSLEEFVQNFFLLVACLHTERDHKAAYAYQKTSIVRFKKTSPEFFYSTLLTGYSFKFVQRELSRRAGMKIESTISEGFYKIRVHGETFCTSLQTCDCTPQTSMALPCRHIFALRDHLGIDLKDESICDERWTRNYYYKHQRVFDGNTELEEVVPHTITTANSTHRILSQHEKYRKAAVIVKDIAGLASGATGRLFIHRMEVLATIKKAWQEDCEVYITRTDEKDGQEEANHSDESESSLPAPLLFEDDRLEASASDAVDDNNADCNVILPKDGQTVAATETPDQEINDSDSESSHTEDIHPKARPQTTKNLQTIIVPPAQKRKGRPKGAEKTTIGLPKRAQKVGSKKQPFSKKSETDKIVVMLQWFVEDELAEAAATRKIVIQECDVETRPDKVSYAVLDPDVNVPLIKRFFSNDAWKVVKGVCQMKKKNSTWNCGCCEADLDDTVGPENSCPNTSTFDDKITIRCDYCLNWYHLLCVHLKNAPKTKFWMCPKCR